MTTVSKQQRAAQMPEASQVNPNPIAANTSTTYYPLRTFDWTAIALLLAALATAASRLVSTNWTDGLSVVVTITVLGLIAGLALGQSRFSPRTVFFFAFVFGLFTVSWQIGLNQQNEAFWDDRMGALLLRLGIIIYQLIHKLTIRDSLLFLVLMGFLFWGLSVHAGYVLVRYADAWKATLPAGLAIFVIHYFDPLVVRRGWALAFYIFFTLMLVARMTFLGQRSRWQANRTALPPHLSLDFIRFTMLFASLIVVVAWTAPALAKAVPAAQKLWQPVRTSWNSAVDDMNYAFASLRSTRPVYSTVYGNNTTLGQGTPLGPGQIFTVRAPLDVPTGVRYYWRARTFDTYHDGQWFSTIDSSHDFDPENNDLSTTTGTGRFEGSFEVTSAVNMGTLFTPAQPLWLSRPSKMDYVKNPDGTLDISTIIADPFLRPGEIYQVKSSVSAPTITELRQTGEDYPAWVTERYLQLPENITAETKQLAEKITAGLETPYDKAAAITEYLRKNITYVETLDGQPQPGQEVIDWFLFDYQKGFCNYYATAEVVLLRLAGIPARWSIGYAQGELITEEKREARPELGGDTLLYRVRQKDAHAWPEAYFPGIGWVEFEPTVGQSDIERPLGDTQDPTIPNLSAIEQRDRALEEAERLIDRNTQPPTPFEQAPQRALFWLAGILAGLILLLVLATFLLPALGIPGTAAWLERSLRRLGLQPPQNVRRWAERSANQQVIQLKPVPVIFEAALKKIGLRPPRLLRQWARRAQLPPLALAYTEINRSLSRLGRPAAVTDTPAERAEALGTLVPPTNDPAHRLVNEYQFETFGQQPADLEAARLAARDIRRFSTRAVLQRFLSRFQVQDRGGRFRK
jgi:transglutaminase-like putative cysteine protease